MYDILISNTSYLNENMEVISNSNIGINNGKIFLVSETVKAKKLINGKGLLWMPGLVDGHIHTSQQLLRGRLLDEKPVIWKRINVPFENQLTDKATQLSAKLAAVEMIKSGTTGFLDIGIKKSIAAADVYMQSGLRGQISCFSNDSKFAPDNLRSSGVSESIDSYYELKDTLKSSQLINPFLSVTAPSVVSENFMCKLIEKSIEEDVPFSTHLNEYSSEVFDFIEKYGKRPFEYFNDKNLLSEKFIAAHCLMLSQQEIKIIKDNNVKVIHCPFSNCGKGVPNTPQLLFEGIDIGFGSDGAGHGGLDLFKEIRTFRSVMNATRGIEEANPQIMEAKTLLKLATVGSSKTFFDNSLGTIREGNTADIIAMKINEPHLFPTNNIVNTIVESACGNDIVNMIVDGKLLMENRKVLTIDENELMDELSDIEMCKF